MKEIKLTQGQVALVDDEDYDWLNQWKWHAKWHGDIQGYRAARWERSPNGKLVMVYMSRQILSLGYGDERQADHTHHNTLDHRRSELRIVTNQENNQNRTLTKGYTWRKHIRKFEAQIAIGQVGGYRQTKHLGYFDNPAEAHHAYLAAKKAYHHIP